MRTSVVIAFLFGSVLACAAIKVTLFSDTETFVKRGKDIIIADCIALPTNRVVVTNGHAVIKGFYDGLHPVEVDVLRTLKGGKSLASRGLQRFTQ